MRLPWQQVEPLNARDFADVKRAAIFECCKWDPQVEDVCALAPFPLVLHPFAWRELGSFAEKLARETLAAETAILERPSLWKRLGMPWALRRQLSHPDVAAGRSHHVRLMRFDFHYTREGWRISEVNCDVPGGLIEASGFTRLMARHYGTAAAPCDPVLEIVCAIAKVSRKPATVALIHATAFADDRQVMCFLSQRLQQRGQQALLLAPDHLAWADGEAYQLADRAAGPLDFVFRFFPAEWLPALPQRSAWWHLLGGSRTPLCNPGLAILCQSKRFPLVWEELPVRLPTWETLLPRTLDVMDKRCRSLQPPSWVFKPAFGRVGDMIGMDGVTSERESRTIRRAIRRDPRFWVAQERFEAVPLQTPDGDCFPCIGIYTLDGAVIGAYGRIARRPLINHLAQDAAVLIATEAGSCGLNETLRYDTDRPVQTVGA